MQLMIVVLNQVECLEKLLKRLGEEGHTGATILDSQGMAHRLSEHDELRFMASLRMLLDPEHRKSKTIFMVLKDEQVASVAQIVNKVTGGLDKPDTGILFTIPIHYVEGLNQAL